MALYTMKELLQDAQQKKYGSGFFDTFNTDMVQAVIRAAEDCNSPVIIGTAEVLLNYCPFEVIMPAMLEAARQAKVPVAVTETVWFAATPLKVTLVKSSVAVMVPS